MAGTTLDELAARFGVTRDAARLVFEEMGQDPAVVLAVTEEPGDVCVRLADAHGSYTVSYLDTPGVDAVLGRVLLELGAPAETPLSLAA